MTILKRIFSKATVVLLGAIALTTSGCGVFLTLEANSKSYGKKHNGKNDDTDAVFNEDRLLVDMADRFGLMALFAETVYRRELPVADGVRDKEGCKYLEVDGDANIHRGMPREKNAAEGWERWAPPADKNAETPCLNNASSGLFYETYVYREKPVGDEKLGRFSKAVIAFRGTENSLSQMIADWSTSLLAVFGIEPSQYEEARERIPRLITHLRNTNPGMLIYATGHSLGGGLAQQAGYISPEIEEVFAFNTSPVTNWTQLRRKGLVRKAYPVIHRVYHGGEFLELPRFVSTSTTSARYERHDIGVQFGKRNAASGHSMKILACNFALLLSQTKAEGAHHYPTSYVDSHVLTVETSYTKKFPIEEEKARREAEEVKQRDTIGLDPKRRICDPDEQEK